MKDSKRSKSRHLETSAPSGRLSQSPYGVPPLLPTAPDGLARAGEHGVAGEPGTSPAYPDAIGDTTEVTSTSTSGMAPPHTGGAKLVSPGDRLQAERQNSIQHERYVARAMKGHTTPASGAFGIVGDVRAYPFVVSCKRTVKRTVSLVEMIEEACRYAEETDLVPAVAIRLQALADGVEKDWAVVPLRVLSTMVKARHPQDGREVTR